MTKTIATHNGMFHTDDIFAVATLLNIYPDAEVIRTRDAEKIKAADVVVDVGFEYDPIKERFDHHQPGGAGMRPNGIAYASFGLVWKEYGERLAGVEGKTLIEEKLVMPIDAPDNGIATYTPIFEGVRPYTIHDFFYSFIGDYAGGEEYLYKTFIECVKVAKGLLEREIKKAQERVESMKVVREIYDNSPNKAIIVLEKALPWEAVLTPIFDTRFVVYPRREGNWGAKAVPALVNGFERKVYFPESWAGKMDEELKDVSGVEGAVFCHRGKFLAVANSKEAAIELAEKALNA
ncbi:MYG1 family protein [Candidatus Parcubacteria bacterium]|nr:MYG1 family protein [Candidatus Parcubacteria bacterium]